VDHETDINVIRKEADISEQKRLVSLYLGDKSKPYSGQKYSAAVFECMAINPVYQKYLEEKIMQSTIGIITNVREDHTEQLGNTLEEIAKSLCSTIPTNGHLITAESNPEVLNIIRSECAIKNTRLHIVSGESIAEGSMKKFTHYEHKTNVAVALKAAQLLGVDRKTAMLGMHKAQPDPGAFRLASLEVPKKKFYWANMFAINDRESFVLMVNELQKKVGDKTKKAVILNNRHDRPERVIQFLDICLEEIKADYIITFGDYEKQIVKEF
jgi:poly-gamma-glutamate synthase PgsB/CapB